MGITVLQINIKSFLVNKYLLNVEINNHQPDIVLLNETSKVYGKISIRGYKTIALNNELYDGIAILYKTQLNVEHLYFHNKDLLAIKLFTNFGPIIIATTYAPPRRFTIPIISLNRLFSIQLPILFIADINAKHNILNTNTVSIILKPM